MRSYPAATPESEMPGTSGIAVEKTAAKLDRRVSVAPMMDWTDDQKNSLPIS
jgi:hypothetical protein